MKRGQLLRLLASLPLRHQEYLFKEIRARCDDYYRWRDITTDDLYSEVYCWLIGVTGNAEEDVPRHDEETSSYEVHEDPKHDQRVQVLLNSATNWRALKSRCSDIHKLRSKWFRYAPGGSARPVLVSDEVLEKEIDDRPKIEGALRTSERAAAIHGAVILAESEFAPDDDRLLLLRALECHCDLWDEFSAPQPRSEPLMGCDGGRSRAPRALIWPVKDIVEALNKEPLNGPWDNKRVDEAKRLLVNWMFRIMKRSGFDEKEDPAEDDLEALLVRLSRNLSASKEET